MFILTEIEEDVLRYIFEQNCLIIQGGWNYPERNYPESVGIIRKTLELSGKNFARGQYGNYPEKFYALEKSLKIRQKPLLGLIFERKKFKFANIS